MKLTLIGYGFVGKAVFNVLNEHYDVKIVDPQYNMNTITDDSDGYIICVPTPLGIHNEPDLSYILNTLNLIKGHLNYNQLLILESTTYPGTTDEVIVPFLQNIQLENSRKKRSKLTIGSNFFVGYSPEREDPGNKNYTTKTIPKVVSGYTQKCLKYTNNIYERTN